MSVVIAFLVAHNYYQTGATQMETVTAHAGIDTLFAAIASHDAAYTNRRAVVRQAPRLKFKPLVLKVVPTAKVQRVSGAFECYIGGEHVHCRGEHITPDKAWLCLARFIVAESAK